MEKQSPISVTSISNRLVCILSEEDKTYLRKIEITDDDPACIFTWRDDDIIQLIALINNPQYNQVVPFPVTMPMTIT